MCQLNVKPIVRLGMNSQSNSKSHLKMTKETKNYLVNSSLLSLLARKYGLRHAIISGRVCQPIDKLFLT